MMQQLVATDSTHACQIMDSLDEQQIMSTIQGKISTEVASKIYYQHGKGQKAADCLSKAGLDECVNEMSRQGKTFKEENITYTSCPIDPEYMVFQARVGIYQRTESGEIHLRTVVGTKRKGLKMSTRQGNMQDPYWFEKGSQMAVRNALRKLVPIAIQQKVMLTAKAVSNGYVIQSAQHQVRQHTPPQQTRQIQQPKQKALPVNKEYLEEAAAYSKQQRKTVTPDVTLESLIENQDWMAEPFPWQLTFIANGKLQREKLKWEELVFVELITTKSGKEMSLRQYLHILEGNDNRKTALRAAAALEIFKKEKEPAVEQAEMFGGEAEVKHSDPA